MCPSFDSSTRKNNELWNVFFLQLVIAIDYTLSERKRWFYKGFTLLSNACLNNFFFCNFIYRLLKQWKFWVEWFYAGSQISSIYSTPLNNHVYQSNCRLIVPRAKECMHINEHTTICTQSILLCTPHLCNQLSLARW